MTSSEGFQTSEVESKRERMDLPLQSWRCLNLGLGRKGACLAGPVWKAGEGTPAPGSQTAAQVQGAEPGTSSGDF